MTMTTKIGDRYNWKNWPEPVIYLGQKGLWHQFAKADEPGTIWCEVLTEELHMLEESVPMTAIKEQDMRAAFEELEKVSRLVNETLHMTGYQSLQEDFATSMHKLKAALQASKVEPVATDSEDYLRISKSGCSVKVGWHNEKRIVAKCPCEFSDSEGFKQWWLDAERLCEGWNRTSQPTTQPASIQSREDKMVTLEFTNGLPKAWCDPEIADLVKALNDGGLRTIASCSGHGHRPGSIVLEDKRELLIMTFNEARALDALFPIDINGERMPAPIQHITREKAVQICEKVMNSFHDDAGPYHGAYECRQAILAQLNKSSEQALDKDGERFAFLADEYLFIHGAERPFGAVAQDDRETWMFGDELRQKIDAAIDALNGDSHEKL